MNAAVILVLASLFTIWAIAGGVNYAVRLWDRRKNCQHRWLPVESPKRYTAWHLVRCTKCGKEDIDV